MTALVHYRTPQGDAALLRHAVTDLATLPTAETPPVFQETTRLGAFRWHTDTYSTTVQTLTTDGHKTAVLSNFHYDPLTRRYDVTITSHHEQPIDDKLTVEALGPHGVMIYTITTPVHFLPNTPFTYQFEVPTDRGEVLGLHVIVHDPLDVQLTMETSRDSGIVKWVIQKINDLGEAVFNGLKNALGPGKVDALLVVSGMFSMLGIELIGAKLECTYTDGCKSKLDGVFADDKWPITGLNKITTAVRKFLAEIFPDTGPLKFEELVEKISEPIPVGSEKITLDIGVTYTRTFSPTCEDAATTALVLALTNKDINLLIEPLNKRLSEGAEKIKGAKIEPPLLGPFWALSLAPIVGFKIESSIPEDNPLSIVATVQATIGLEGAFQFVNPLTLFRLALTVALSLKVLVILYDIIIGIQDAQEILAIIKSMDVAAKKSCPPNPPNGHPDDRRDAVAGGAPPPPSGLTGQLLYLQQQLATAERAGLTRAATYWRLQLRQTELQA